MKGVDYLFKVIIKNEYEELWRYRKEHGSPDLEEPEFDRIRFGDGVIHQINNEKELFNLWSDAKKLNLSDSYSDFIWTDVCIEPSEDHILLIIYEHVAY